LNAYSQKQMVILVS